MSTPITEKASVIINDVRRHYVVPHGEQAPGVLTDGHRQGLKRKVADNSRTQYEIYSYATRHNLSESAMDELLALLTNVSTSE